MSKYVNRNFKCYRGYNIYNTAGHYEVYYHGNFFISADTIVEAIREIDKFEEEVKRYATEINYQEDNERN